MDIIEKVKNFVEQECGKPESKYGFEPFEFHFVPVVRYAERLCDELGGDREVISIAAWMHDIGSIVYGREDHHITSAKIAVEKLSEFGYPQEKIGFVEKCILNHRGSQKRGRETLEEQIVAEADVLANFDEIAGIFKAAFVYEGLTQGQARESVLQKLTNKFEQLHFEKSKEIIRPKFEAVKILLGK
ncbi:MAG TPA: hypothetical protein DCX32_00320 [Candidatus Moranbacteria bacterium]|nr:MAG: hypothetical protein UW87_C0005G0013 [Candidatus Moranbacteria bacterium GW2011_GWC2_45_10]KKT95291.1 MAG: hypothetical protein UW95_C0002G0034 [Parcubacteria group bacterium GW2011_GWC1_45_14]HAV10982.1 hypothetical protein [Candidatus Moranbacteria bacterium]